MSYLIEIDTSVIEEDPPEGHPVVPLEAVGDDFSLPRAFSLRYQPRGDEPGWHMQIEVHHGAPRVRRLVFEASDDGREIRSRDLRDVRVEDMLELAAKNAAFRREVDPDGQERMVRQMIDLTSGASLGAVRAARRGARRKLTPDMLTEVARVYRENIDDKPTQAVADHYDVEPRTARLYVQRARASGKLGDAIRGKAGEQ